MAIATTSTYRPNRDRVIKNALRLVGVLQASQSPSADQLAMGADFLVELMLALQGEGVMLRARTLEEKTLTSGSASFTTPTGTLDIEPGAVVRDTNGNDAPCDIITQDQYNAIADKDLQGRPIQYFPKENDDDSFTVYLYQIPDSTWVTFIYPRVRKVRDLDTGNLDLDCPTKWLHGIGFGLAWKFALHYRRPIGTVGLYGDYWQAEKERILRDETPRGPLEFTVEPLFPRWT